MGREHFGFARSGFAGRAVGFRRHRAGEALLIRIPHLQHLARVFEIAPLEVHHEIDCPGATLAEGQVEERPVLQNIYVVPLRDLPFLLAASLVGFLDGRDGLPAVLRGTVSVRKNRPEIDRPERLGARLLLGERFILR